MCLCEQIAALEMQKELVLSQVEDWIADAEKYLNFLRYCLWIKIWLMHVQYVCMCKGNVIPSGFVLILDRLNPSQNHLHQRQKWEQNVAMVRSSLVGLKVREGANIGGFKLKRVSSFSHCLSFVFHSQNKFNENHQLLQRGEQLDSLPSVPIPLLPPVPTVSVGLFKCRLGLEKHYCSNPFFCFWKKSNVHQGII